MQVDIISPDKEIFSGEATFVGVPGVDGSMGILNNHAPLITTLRTGEVKVKDSKGNEECFEVKGGVLEVMDNKVIILAE